ncbi:MAG: DUF1320 domain-containing protein [Bacteroidetes bacterium]|nr:DUF1320 domain-containing protein [Bacteroidota bacterium]
MFLQKEELKTVSTEEIINKIIGGDDDIVTNIINESIALMKGYMSRFYDVEEIFSREGAERHLATLKRLKDIVIYEIYERHTRNQNAVAARRYNEAMNWLEKLSTGELGDKTLPPVKKIEPISQSGESRFGGNRKYESIY